MGVSPEQLCTKKLTMTLNTNTLKFSTLTFLLNVIMQEICAYIILIKNSQILCILLNNWIKWS